MNPPVGLVALVTTDVEKSTPLWEAARDAMAQAMAVHDDLLRTLLARAGGYEVRMEGDALLAAFADAEVALRWCVDAQEALASAPWPDALLQRPEAAIGGGQRGLRVRMGVHMGEPLVQRDPTSGRMSYRGAAAARSEAICRAAHGGQILVSDAAWTAARAGIEGDPHILHQDLGAHRLRGLDADEHLIQLTPASLAERVFPPPAAQAAQRGNLPPESSTFVGREEELEELDRMSADGVRLITLLGSAGIGKTRLALHFATTRARRVAPDGGAWFFDLSEVGDLNALVATVAEALQITLKAGLSATAGLDSLGRALGEQARALWVLDNVEQCAEAAREALTRWLAVAPQARFLVTSRVVLAHPSERTVDLGPLGEDAAVELFIERARTARRDFSLGEGDRAIISEIVARLECIPLAIELAAARAAVLPVRVLLERVANRFQLLQGRRRDARARQATLTGAIDWSWDMLSPAERAAMAWLSVFQGGCDTELVEGMLPQELGGGRPAAAELLAALRQKSLLRAWEDPADPEVPRYGMYELIRAYAAEKLTQSGQRAQAEAAHGAVTLARGLAQVELLHSAEGARALRRLAVEGDNLLAVLRRALEPPVDGVAAVRALSVLEPVWTNRGVLEVHQALADAVVAAAPDVETAALARYHRASIRRLGGRLPEAAAETEAAVQLARASGQERLAVRAMALMGRVQREQGRVAEARFTMEQGLAAARQLGDQVEESSILGSLGLLWMELHQPEAAEACFLEALEVARAAGNRKTEATVLGNLGVLCQEQGRYEEALTYNEAALAVHGEFGNRRNEASQWSALGVLQLDLGQHERAAEAMRKAVALHSEVGVLSKLLIARTELGLLELDRGDIDAAEAAFRGVLATAGDQNAGLGVPLAWANLGILQHLRGNLDEALDAFDRATALFQAASFQRGLVIVTAYRAGLLAQLDRLDEATAAFATATAELSKSTNELIRTIVSLIEAQLELCSSRRRASEGDLVGARERLESARARLAAARRPFGPARRVPVEISHDVRLAARILERALQDPTSGERASTAA